MNIANLLEWLSKIDFALSEWHYRRASFHARRGAKNMAKAVVPDDLVTRCRNMEGR